MAIPLHQKRISLDIWRELVTFVRFGCVGIAATLLHIIVVWLLLKTGLAPLSANALAFLSAFLISFIVNYIWTFRTPGNPRRAMVRFFIIAASAFFFNTLLLSFLLKGGWFSPVTSAVLSASIVPVISFSASRLWGFSSHAEAEK